ncbi:phosphoglycerate mutase, 2,3-bisphosphoglycerate-independent [Solidesulfovibrio fructosivorans JJ]]|uniref:2,3-bisphosphoglycerate-independent phosphoglycerate mutase n=1 Tax=Solidesulfovibrio fructosivorans JJ] TaxID=596151 RepID=E1JV29_SOLFR|nr:2,3-bisphosphoglycerate-independent phosphoglycerate mutase [Solidesulfovibrio fructosivorans]EFL51943.1 phosphoglycerate mutase, 2,3-bisphosphoglycerate-independent [Solidesulfovibrio fructosivorans JJ]]
MKPTPTLLLILDGWGLAPDGPGNAVTEAGTPTLDRLLAANPSTILACSGRAVGLPDGFMGNSEVGHMNIGAGRVVYQDMTRIDMAVEEGNLAANPVLADLAKASLAAGGRVHLMGLVSDGGVHSHVRHLKALVETFIALGQRDILVHAFLDGRDTPPQSGAGYVAGLEAFLRQAGTGRIASLTGRFYAMDRDKRFDRVAAAYAGLTEGAGEVFTDPVAAVKAAYAAGETDEFVKPRVLAGGDGVIRDGDAVFFFNFRADRAREITAALTKDDFDGFARTVRPKLSGFATMTEYEGSFQLPVAFAPESISDVLGEVYSREGLTQLRLAETEKYAHVTYFMNCGREEPFPGEERILVPSPRDVATYDLKPEMSAVAVTDAFLASMDKGHSLSIVNLANCDMVGHTGILEAAKTAVRTVDACVARIADAVASAGWRMLVTADHGNAEEMIASDGGPMTAHTLNPVRLILVDPAKKGGRLSPGKLGDIAPTLLTLAGLPVPAAMTGNCLFSEQGK